MSEPTVEVPLSLLAGVMAELQQLYDGGVGYDLAASHPSDRIGDLLTEHGWLYGNTDPSAGSRGFRWAIAAQWVWTSHCHDCDLDIAAPDDPESAAKVGAHLTENPGHSIVGIYRSPLARSLAEHDHTTEN